MSRAMISAAAVTTPSTLGLLARLTRYRRAIQALCEDRHYATFSPQAVRAFRSWARGWSRCERHSEEALVAQVRHFVTACFVTAACCSGDEAVMWCQGWVWCTAFAV